MRTQLAVFIVGVLLGFAMLTATNSLAAQEPAPAGSVPIADQAALLHVATPEATDAEMAEKMDRMMEQCSSMMEMMSMMMGMMGGDMSGMMGGEGMHGMGDMPVTPAPTP